LSKRGAVRDASDKERRLTHDASRAQVIGTERRERACYAARRRVRAPRRAGHELLAPRVWQRKPRIRAEEEVAQQQPQLAEGVNKVRLEHQPRRVGGGAVGRAGGRAVALGARRGCRALPPFDLVESVARRKTQLSGRTRPKLSGRTHLGARHDLAHARADVVARVHKVEAQVQCRRVVALVPRRTAARRTTSSLHC
jgi:hypothetical protein